MRQRNIRQDNTKDRAGTLPLNLYESETILNPLNLQLVTTGVQPDIIESLDNEVREEHTTGQPEPIDTYSESDSDTDSRDENEHADQPVTAKLHLYTDAAASLGYGAVFGLHWLYGQWPSNWLGRNIIVLEMFPIVRSLSIWASELANK